MTTDLARRFAAAARLIDEADSLIIGAGAGMGVDSGLPDFRGPGGFWQVYPALGRAKIRFEEIASPAAFRDDPTLAWGFYGHRLNLYRATVPHEGFRLLKKLVDSMPQGASYSRALLMVIFSEVGFPNWTWWSVTARSIIFNAWNVALTPSGQPTTSIQ